MTNDMNEPLYIETPLVSSPILSKLAGWYSPRSTRTSYVDGSKILLKLENLQPSGSFKSRYHKGFREVLRFRGLGNLCKKMSERLGQGEEPHFFCSSEGNAGTLLRRGTLCDDRIGGCVGGEDTG
jgi:L-serine/L-threonine ammonia-lyase